MPGYTKLFSSILASTIWREDDKVRLVWITLLAMADKDGVAEGSIPGIADMARVSVEDCEEALQKLMSPDKYSRSKEHDGRRIKATDGGFLILNHAKYRQKLSADERREYNRKKQADYRERQKKSADVTDCQSQSAMSAHTEAEAEAASEAESRSRTKETKVTAPFGAAYPDESEFECFLTEHELDHLIDKRGDLWQSLASSGWKDGQGQRIKNWQNYLIGLNSTLHAATTGEERGGRF